MTTTRVIVPSGVEYTKWAINPYRGCGHNCPYCYGPLVCYVARENWRNAKPKEWFTQPSTTYADITKRVEDELEYLPPGESIMISTSTDAFQPIESRYGLMTPILRGLRKAEKNPVLICTKSDRVLNYMPLLLSIPHLEVGFTISCTDDLVRCNREPEAPSYFLRFAALEALIREGIKTWISCEPIFPEVSPIPLIHRAKEMGVKRMVFGKLNYQGNNHNDWYREIREEIVEVCRFRGMPYMLKKELRVLPKAILAQGGAFK